MNLGLGVYFSLERKRKPSTRRVTIARYPDGREVRIEPARGCGRGMWTYDRGAAAGPGKGEAIAQARYAGATIEVRVERSA
ncbi:MAG: hypothetical protein K2X12_02965 [Burkholderiaceae bacterium]|jgi:hypothetical protein|nr:hypothetical protein [Burkholderiaceae bacterium]